MLGLLVCISTMLGDFTKWKLLQWNYLPCTHNFHSGSHQIPLLPLTLPQAVSLSLSRSIALSLSTFLARCLDGLQMKICVALYIWVVWMIKFWFCVWWRYRCRHWWIWRKYSRIYTNTMTVGKCLLLLSMSCTYADLSPEFAFCYLTDKIIQKFCSLQERDTDWRESMYSTKLDVRTHSNNFFRLLCIRASMLLDIPNIPVPARIQC